MLGQSTTFIRGGKACLALLLCLTAAITTGCDPDVMALTPIATLKDTPVPRPSSPPTHFPTVPPPSSTPTPTITPTPRPVDYAPMIAEIESYVKTVGLGPQFDMSVGFMDVQSGQRAEYDGVTKHFALSTFKGLLGAYYFWLVEQGKLKPEPDDLDMLEPMMSRSDNESTSCTFRRVGGLAGFNDWLAEVGMSRENNFVAQWQNWACTENEQTYLLPPDRRYMTGDKALGLPGGYTITLCYPRKFQCFEAFSPVELAALYAKLYRGEVLNEQNTAQWMALMKKADDEAALIAGLNDADQFNVTAYVKNGFSAKNESYAVNFQHEAGIVVTPYGVYTLAVFTQGNPDWPGLEPVKRIGRIVYDYFATNHGAAEGK